MSNKNFSWLLSILTGLVISYAIALATPFTSLPSLSSFNSIPILGSVSLNSIELIENISNEEKIYHFDIDNKDFFYEVKMIDSISVISSSLKNNNVQVVFSKNSDCIVLFPDNNSENSYRYCKRIYMSI